MCEILKNLPYIEKLNIDLNIFNNPDYYVSSQLCKLAHVVKSPCVITYSRFGFNFETELRCHTCCVRARDAFTHA